MCRNTEEPRRARRTREEGQTMAEYAVVLGVISIGVITAFASLSSWVEGAIQGVVDVFPG
jgi:Flp pilus assembly pilin Flp